MAQKHISIDWDAIREAYEQRVQWEIEQGILPADFLNPVEPEEAKKTLKRGSGTPAKANGNSARGNNLKGRKPLFDPQQIIEKFKSGMTQEQIAKDMRCSLGTVKRVLGRAELLTASVPRNEPKFDYEKIVSLRKSTNMSMRQIAERMGCSTQTVYNVLTKAGMTKRRK
jgi:DNA invertase Pin-like site-specific DNA recombinase